MAAYEKCQQEEIFKYFTLKMLLYNSKTPKIYKYNKLGLHEQNR